MFRSLAIAALVMTASAIHAQQPAPRLKPVRTGYVPANGVNYYYEIYGRGAPLLLLHGGLGSTGMFAPILPALVKGRQVIAVDLHGHGRTALGDRPINLVDIGNDLAVVVKQLGYDTVDVMGYSFGGGAALRLAVQHPEAVRRLVIVYGDADMIRPEHIVSFYQLLGGGLKDAGWQREHMSQNRLAILPNVTHYEMFMSPALAPAVLPFLNGELAVSPTAR